MLSRRDLLICTGQTCLLGGFIPLASGLANKGSGISSSAIRCINVVNFIRGVEPRFETDLLLPVRKQMELVLEHGLPATWLLQFDALVAGPFVEFLKAHKAKNHEVGFWFEMNQKLCDAAGVNWRGREGYEWDSHPAVAFTIGYSPAERIKLADAAMHEFKSIWGRYPSSIASWNLDSISMAHLSENYGIDAYAVCRDQIATDGFTIWGAPIAGYFPSKTNCWSPAVRSHNQISTPVFRMLGQDPVYYYDNGTTLPDGKVVREPDTMEPVWTSGRSDTFVQEFLKMISDAPTLSFAYAQLGQENSFPWPDTAEAYPKQMEALARLRDLGAVHVETLGETGLRFKNAFGATPVQAQVQLNDPFGNTHPSENSIWYQSRYYRANLHVKGDLPYLRDLTVYSDRYPQPFLSEATRDHEVEQKMPAILDGYHWSKEPGKLEQIGAGGFFMIADRRVSLSASPRVSEEGKSLLVELLVEDGNVLHIRFDERQISFRVTPRSTIPLSLSFEWDPSKSALVDVQPKRVAYRRQGFDYSLQIKEGSATATTDGFLVSGNERVIILYLAQPS